MKELLLSLLAWVLGVAFSEIKDWMPWLARRIIRSAVMALEENDRERMREELLAEVAAVPGKISPLLFAFHLWWGFWRGAIVAKASENACRSSIRFYDVFFSGTAYFLSSPLFLCIAIGTKLTGGGPILIKRKIMGVGGKTFWVATFRTRDLVTGERCWFGGFLERTDLYRLPLYISILRGDLSLVGPAPQSPKQSAGKLIQRKPGLLWFSTFGVEVPAEFGKKTWPTLCGHLRLISLALKRTLFAGEK